MLLKVRTLRIIKQITIRGFDRQVKNRKLSQMAFMMNFYTMKTNKTYFLIISS